MGRHFSRFISTFHVKTIFLEEFLYFQNDRSEKIIETLTILVNILIICLAQRLALRSFVFVARSFPSVFSEHVAFCTSIRCCYAPPQTEEDNCMYHKEGPHLLRTQHSACYYYNLTKQTSQPLYKKPMRMHHSTQPQQSQP